MTGMRSTALLGLFAAIVAAPFAARADEAIAIYKTKCSGCHRIDGGPVAGRLKLRDLTSDRVRKLSDAEIAAAIAKGKGRMPPFASSLSGQEIADLVKYIRSAHR